MRLAIFGDSFATFDSEHSWSMMLNREYTVDNFSQRGASEYRIYKLLTEQDLSMYDRVIIFHTNADRVFVPDYVDYPSRQLASHPQCDMLVADSLSKHQWADIAKLYYKNFYDQDFQNTLFDLLLREMLKLTIKGIHCSGFECSSNVVQSFAHLRISNPGNINHLDQQGNLMIYQYLKGQLL